MNDPEYYIEKVAEKVEQKRIQDRLKAFKCFPKAEELSNGNYLVAGIECSWGHNVFAEGLFITKSEVERIDKLNENNSKPKLKSNGFDQVFYSEEGVGEFIIKYLQ